MFDTQCVAPTRENLERAAALWRAGEVVAFPTETVYGLGANALDEAAVRKIFAAKNRPADNPLIVHIARMEQLDALCEASPAARALMDAFWPGPLTILLPKKSAVPDIVTAGLDTVGVRMPSHSVAKALLLTANLPIAAPSANLSTRPSPTAAGHVMEDMQGRIPMVIDGGVCDVGVESTVLSLQGDKPVILRPGAVTMEMVASVIGNASVADSVMRPLKEGESAPSPGMRHRHYAPHGRMTLVCGEEGKVAEKIRALYSQSDNACVLARTQNLPLYKGLQVFDLGADEAAAAHNIFALLREADHRGFERIFSEGVVTRRVGLAVMNRMARAAAFDILEV